MVVRKVRSLVDTHLNTCVSEYNISIGQVFTCEFKSQLALDELVRIGVLELVDPETPEAKPFPVFYPSPVPSALFDENGVSLPLSGGLEGSELEQDVTWPVSQS